MELKNSPVASTPQIGNEGDGIIQLMKKAGLPMDRETYLELAFFGDAPEELSAEQEADIPEIFKE